MNGQPPLLPLHPDASLSPVKLVMFEAGEPTVNKARCSLDAFRRNLERNQFVGPWCDFLGAISSMRRLKGIV